MNLFQITFTGDDSDTFNYLVLAASKLKAIKQFSKDLKEEGNYEKVVILNTDDLGEGSEEDVRELIDDGVVDYYYI